MPNATTKTSPTKSTTTDTAPTRVAVPRLPGSNFPTVHKARGPIRQALESIPGWLEGVAAISHLHKIRPVFTATDIDVQGAISELIETAVEQQTAFDREAAAAHVRGILDRSAAAVATDEAFERVIRSRVAALDTCLVNGAERIYTHLTESCRAIVTEARTLGDLLDVDAEQAVDTDRYTDWKRLKSLRTEFASLRGEYATLRNALGWNAENMNMSVPELLWFANPGDVFPAWSTRSIAINKARPGTAATPPWPTEYDPTRSNEEATRLWFEFFVTTEAATAWTPSAKQFDKAMAVAFPTNGDEYPGSLAVGARTGGSRSAGAGVLRTGPAPVSSRE